MGISQDKRIKRKSKLNKSEINWTDLDKDMTEKGISLSFLANRKYTIAKHQISATMYDDYLSLSLAIRDRIVERWIQTQQVYHDENRKRVYYLSMEFLIGRLLGNYICNLGIENETKKALKGLGLQIEEIYEQEVDAGLGNGGLGRLAACFLDSMATLSIPAQGYGIRYEYGVFKQKIKDGYQIELPDEWLRLGTPWEFPRPEYSVKVKFFGKVDMTDGVKWIETEDVLAVPYDVPIVGYKNGVVNTLRLWSARSTEEFDFDYFNHGDYEKAVYQKIFSENISKVLYPNDSQSVGRELRLKQEYFFTSASIADILRRFKAENSDLRLLPEKAVIQLNDTHPAIGVLELIRVLLDQENMDWDGAWDITKQTFAYTNHTLMPEALECWSVELLGHVLPRHLQILFELNRRFLDHIRLQFPGDEERVQRMSLVDENGDKSVRMASLSIVGSFSVNGVSRLHTDLIKKHLFKDFFELYPEKFNSKTNGITQRRWLLESNPGLSNLIKDLIGDKWITNLDELGKLSAYRDDAAVLERWQKIKYDNKVELAKHVRKMTNITIDPSSLFDVQVKRIHEYKRQMLFALYILSVYLKIKQDPKSIIQPRTFLIGGKAAPGYKMAKLIIKFITTIAQYIHNDKSVSDKIKLIFLENYRVSLAERIFPGSDLSEQISTAGTEASGTGNMKFMLNGALTIGTLDGANIEISEFLDPEDIFIFGLKTSEVEALKEKGYNPKDYVKRSPLLKEIFSMLGNNFFSTQNPDLFKPILKSIFQKDPYLVCADFEDYCRMQDKVSHQYQDSTLWTKKSMNNVANAGYFSSDRTIREYAKEIWKIPTDNHKKSA